MKVIVDLDDTLVATSELNNDAYNFALEYNGYSRIKNLNRINRSLIDVERSKLQNIIQLKERYFCAKWLMYRTFINDILIDKILCFGRDKCFLWTAASPNRAMKIIKELDLQKYFKKIIFDKKINFDQSIQILKANTFDNVFLIYENNKNYFHGQNYNIVDKISNNLFNIYGYFIST